MKTSLNNLGQRLPPEKNLSKHKRYLECHKQQKERLLSAKKM